MEVTPLERIEETVLEPITKIEYNNTYTHIIQEFGFGNIPKSIIIEIYKDGRGFSHLIEPWLATNYPLIHIKGCKQYDFVDSINENIKYEQKTFTKGGCKIMPSNMAVLSHRSIPPKIYSILESFTL